MSQNNTTATQGAASLDDSATQEDMEAKREMARRLMEGDGVDKDKAKAVSLLEDCVAHGDTDATVMLAKCCALARGMEYNAERAESLVSEAAEKGNHEASFLLELINDWKGKEAIELRGLRFFSNTQKGKYIFVVFQRGLSRANARSNVLHL